MLLHTRIIIGLVGGGATGVLVQRGGGRDAAVDALITNVTDPFSRVWLNALTMVVIARRNQTGGSRGYGIRSSPSLSSIDVPHGSVTNAIQMSDCGTWR
jgi:hypothetical protein